MGSKVNYHVTTAPLLIPILIQMHPVHSFPPYVPQIHSNIFPSTSSSSEWS